RVCRGASPLTCFAAVHLSAFDAVDGSSTGTEVPSMWALLRLPRFGGANHADGHDNGGAKAACERSGHLEVGEIARHRDWHGAAHRKGASNEPARGAAMTSGP